MYLTCNIHHVSVLMWYHFISICFSLVSLRSAMHLISSRCVLSDMNALILVNINYPSTYTVHNAYILFEFILEQLQLYNPSPASLHTKRENPFSIKVHILFILCIALAKVAKRLNYLCRIEILNLSVLFYLPVLYLAIFIVVCICLRLGINFVWATSEWDVIM